MSGDSEAGRLLLALDPDKYGKALGAGYSTTEQEVEKIIMRAYEAFEINGKAAPRTIAQMSERTLQNLVDYDGPSALKNTEFYRRSEIYKVFKEKGAFDFTIDKQVGELVDKYKNGMDPGLYTEIKNALSITDEKLKRQTLTELVDGNKADKGLQALLTNSVMRKMETAAIEQGNYLGVYVNRSMVVGATLNQFDDYMEQIYNNAAISDELKKIIGTEIGLLGQETAIDSSTGYSSSLFRATLRNSQDKLQDVASMVSKALIAGGDEDLINAAALQALGLAGDQNLDSVGATAVERLGRRIGSATALMTSQEFGGTFDSSLRPAIDEILLEDRLAKSDVETLLESIRKGVKDARAAQTLTGVELDKIEEQLLNIQPSEAEMRSALSRLFGASATHKYTAGSNVYRAGEEAAIQFAFLKKTNLAGSIEDHILASTNVSEEARKVANVLLDKHTEAYLSMTDNLTNEAAQYEKILSDDRRLRLGQQIYDDITGAQQVTGLSREEMINALDKVAAERRSLTRQRGIDLSRLDYEDENFFRQINTTRQRRRAEGIRVTAGDLEEQVLDDLVNRKILGSGKIDLSNISSTIEQYFEKMLDPASASTQEEIYLAQAGLGEEIVGANEAEKEIARRRARVVQVHAVNQALQQDQATMQALNATGKTTFTGDDNLRRAINASLNDEDYSNFMNAKGKYVRFSEYIKSGELKNLFKNDNIFRSSIYAAGALIVGSFAYQHFKDHTPEKVQGPPLLPGGSAYEGQYPNRVAEIPQIGTTSYNPGVSYKVNLYGNRRQVSQFQDMAMGLGNFDMDTTMYSGIPQVGTDPYQQLASSY